MAAISQHSLQEINELYHSYLAASSAQDADAKVLLSFSGNIEQSKIDAVLSLTESVILDNGIKRKVMKRVCTILIESLQNISIHGTRDDSQQSNSFLVLSSDKNHLHITTGNLILNEDANLVAFKLDELSKLSDAELRKLYIETLCNQNYSYKGGAGLGFLTIAKKSDGPIQYKVMTVNDKFSFFTTEVKVARS